MITVVCFKWKRVKQGYQLPSVISDYTAEHVNNLYYSVQKHLTIPHKFVCITDDAEGVECETILLWDKYRELGGCYHRLYTFSSDMKSLLGGRFVCIDLDTVIVGNLDKIFSRKESFIIHKYYRVSRNDPTHQFYNGGLYMMDAGSRKQVWDTFFPEFSLPVLQEAREKRKVIGSDQAWISIQLGQGEALFDTNDGVYEYRLLPNKDILPENACIIMFSGRRDPSIMNHKWITENWKHDKQKFMEDVFLKEVDRETARASKMLGYNPDILNPRTFNEKILYKKFFYKSPLLKLSVDKATAKNYVKAMLGTDKYIIPEYWVGTDLNKIPFDKLPLDYVVKPTHFSGEVIIVKNGAYTKNGLIHKCRLWMSKKYGINKFERGYEGIEPKIIIQKYLTDDKGAIPVDYKFHIFDGKCGFIYVEEGRIAGNQTRVWYDKDWKPINTRFVQFPDKGKDYPKPEKLQEMVEIAEKLGSAFKFVRVDLFYVNNEIYFGEITHYPDSGTGAMLPELEDRKWGKLIRYPNFDFSLLNGVETFAGVQDCQIEELFYFASITEGNIVEIGSYHGRSTIALASGLNYSDSDGVVYAIDCWNFAVSKERKNEPSETFFKENIKRAGVAEKIKPIKAQSMDIFNKKQPEELFKDIGLLFIDADHKYQAVKEDLQWVQYVKPKGFVIFHDYGGKITGPKQAVDEFIENNPGILKKISVADDLIVFEKQ